MQRYNKSSKLNDTLLSNNDTILSKYKKMHKHIVFYTIFITNILRFILFN